jgi:hypothetical protein
MTAPNEIVARRLLQQAEWCERLGSSLYSTLLGHAAEDVRAAGVCCAVLHDHYDDPSDSALALRFLGAVHRLVLQGKAPQLAACYPSVGGDSNCDDIWPKFRAVVQLHQTVLRELVHLPVQTNEVGRCAALGAGRRVRGTTNRSPAAPVGGRSCRRLDPSMGPVPVRSGARGLGRF